MNLFSIVWRNLCHRPARSVLTASGVALGVAAGVSLCAIAWGLELGWQRTYAARGTDVVVVCGEGRGLLPGDFPLPEKQVMRKIPGVADTAGVLSDLMEVGGVQRMLVYGWEPDSFLWSHLAVRGTTRPSANGGVLLGAVAAEMLGKTTGDVLEIEERIVPVQAVFESPALVENAAVIFPLPLLQEILGRKGKINYLNVRMIPDSGPAEAAIAGAAIAERWPELKAFPAADLARENSGIRAAKAMSLGTAVVALVVAGFGMMNTILAGVHERTRETGLLLALGWRRRRIVGMVMLESLVLVALGAGAGLGAGVVGVRLLQQAKFSGGKLEADFAPELFLALLLAALLLGMVCSVFPALRAGSRNPREALNRSGT